MSLYLSRDSSMSTLATELLNENPEELADADLLRGIDLLTASNRYLALENEVLELYLQRMDPDLLAGLQDVASLPISRSALSMLSSRFGSESGSIRSFLQLTGSSAMSSLIERGPRINMSNKEDIASRETDDLRTALEELRLTSRRKRAALKAKLEETKLSLAEVREAREDLEAATQAGRIPAEKFVRHMDEWLKRADSLVEKLRLRTSTLRSMLVRFNQLLEQKEELGEKLHPIDFEQLKIENKQLQECIEHKNRHLVELKKMAGNQITFSSTGSCNLQLANQKKKMLEQMSDLSELQEEMANKNKQMRAMAREADTVEMEMNKAAACLDNVRTLMDNYSNTVPDVMDYVHKKAELYEMRRALKVWTRRQKIQQTALIACRRVLRQLTAPERRSSRQMFN
ncbi:cilia- and flagella-associated protein 263 [Periplaneta americana]|uniref:cilia- and flagella-associated protein 263 n=1 Tax=Periplaneta americana TaxID=6978 RepID=UPI0037E71ABE